MNTELERLIKKSAEIVKRPSLMDSFVDVPWSSTSLDFKGFYMLLIYLTFVCVSIEVASDLSYNDALINTRLLHLGIYKFKDIFFLWLALCLYSST